MRRPEDQPSRPDARDTRQEARPLVALFRTERNFYVYDTNTSRIVLVDRVLWDVIRRDRGNVPWPAFPAHLPQHEASAVTEAVRKYRHLREEHGLFAGHRPRALKAFAWTADVREQYEGRMQQLILEATENCNLRCKYCSYSEYYPLSRGYSRRTMPFETACKAIDYFLPRSLHAESRSIGFYGGEPLLELDLLARCMEYARARQGDAPLRFSLTTNATLITPEMLESLTELDLHLLVSVDGPPTCHDANRVSVDGRGTAERVLAVLRMIAQRKPEYYRTHVGFTSVIAPNTAPADYYLFFEQNPDLFADGILMANYVSDQNTDYWCRNAPPLEWSAALEALRWKYYESLVRGELPKSRWLESLFRDHFLKIYRRGIYRTLPQTASLNGCCQPGIRRLYVTTDGSMHMCERINRTVPIGHVDTGLDLDRIARIIDEYRAASEADCRNCWLLRLCPMCFATAVGAGRFDRRAKQARCRDLRRQYLRSLRDFCEIAEINPAAFNYMDDIVIK